MKSPCMVAECLAYRWVMMLCMSMKNYYSKESPYIHGAERHRGITGTGLHHGDEGVRQTTGTRRASGCDVALVKHSIKKD